MISELKSNRRNIHHSNTKGEETELSWLNMFNIYLPKRYQSEKGFVLDSNGAISDQIDIIIFDRQYSPPLYNKERVIYVPSESVYAIFEVKQSLNKKNILYANDKAKSVRKLFRTNAPIYHADRIIHEPKEPFRIIAGILTLDSEWEMPFTENIENVIKTLTNEEKLDLGCALDCGAFNINFYGSTKIDISISQKANSLISFFLNFLSSLQKLGTVPAIDLCQYLKTMNGESTNILEGGSK